MKTTDTQVVDQDVAIVGGGPTGLCLALMLARKGHSVIVVERWPQHYPLPRAVTFDDEIARLLFQLGIDAENDPIAEIVDTGYTLQNAQRETLAYFDWRGVTELGWRRLYWFNQPSLELRLAEMLADYPNVQFRRDWEAVALEQKADSVILTGKVGTKAGGKAMSETIRAKYLVGADGANSFVRKSVGLPMKDLGFFFDWLIVDVLPTNDLNLDPPMLQLCDPARPTTVVPAGQGRRRWEFMVLPGEDIAELDTVANIWKLLEPWNVTPETATIERHTVWRFQARWSEQWRKDRVLIAGDAAHQMPPFAGQGMCAGLRDANNLAWRLDLVLRDISPETLLEDYSSERQAHVAQFIHMSMEIGKPICIIDPEAAKERDAAMKAVMADPSLAPPPPPPLSLGTGTWVENTPQAGQAAWQGIVEASGRTGRFDAFIEPAWIILGWQMDPAKLLPSGILKQIDRLGGRCLGIGPVGSNEVLVDNDDFYASWFAQLDVDFIVIRPDGYVAASGKSQDCVRILERLFRESNLLKVDTSAIS